MARRRVAFRTFEAGLWLSGPRENAPKEALRRALGVAPLRYGSIRSRSGDTKILDLDAHSITRWRDNRVVGDSTRLFHATTAGTEAQILTEQDLSGERWTAEPMSPSTELSPIDDRLWIADKDWPVKIKADFTSQRWGIDAPTLAPTAATKNAQLVKVIESCDAFANFVTNGVISGFGNNTVKKLEGTGSITGVVAKDDEGTIDHTGILDLSTFSPGNSADEDYITFAIAFNRPKHVKNVEIAFVVGAAAPADFDNMTDSYSRELNVKVVNQKKRKELRGTGDLVRFKDQQRFLFENPVGNAKDLSTAELIQDDTLAVTRKTWTRVTLPKNTFNKNGRAGTAGFTWANVRGFRISIETTKLGTSRFWIDDIKMIGGVGMQGDYKWTWTYRNSTTHERSNPPIDSAGNVLFVLAQDVERQSVTVAGLVASTDPQVDKIEIWRTFGNGEVYFKSGEVNNGTTTYTDLVADYIGMFSATATPTVLQPIELPLDNAPPPDSIFDCAKFNARMFVLTDHTGDKGRIYYSPIGRPGSVGSDFIEVTSDDEPLQKLLVWNGSLWVYSTSRLFQVAQTDEPFVATPIAGVPGVREGSGRTAVPTPMGLIYQANDGVRGFNGASSEILAGDSLRPVFRQGTVNGIVGMAGVVAAYGRDEYWISDANEAGTGGTTLALDLKTGAWRNHGVSFRSLFYEVETGLLLGSAFECFARGMVIARGVGTNIVSPVPPMYLPPAQPFLTSASTSLTDSQFRCARDMTITAMYVQMSDALDAAESISFRVNVNGVNSTGLVLDLVTGDTIKGATGEVAVAAGDLWTVSIPARTVNTETVISIALAYKARKL